MVDTPRRVKMTGEGTPIPEGFDPGSYVTFIKRKEDDAEGKGRVESVGNRELLITEDATKKLYVVLWEDANPAPAPKAPSKKDKSDKNAAAQTTLT